MVLIIIVVMLFVIMVKVSSTAKTSKMIKKDYKAGGDAMTHDNNTHETPKYKWNIIQ